MADTSAHHKQMKDFMCPEFFMPCIKCRGDPTYITSYKGARSMIMKVERDELVEELLKEYIKNESWKRK